MKRMTMIASIVLAFGIAGAASAETYRCKIEPKGSSGWIPTDIIVSYDPSAGTVMVNDNIIQHFVGSPIPGRLKNKNANRILFAWTVSGIKTESGQYAAGLDYSLNVATSGRASISGKPQRYTNNWYGKGSCSKK